MVNNTFDEKNYEYIYKYWNDPMKICHLISYDFEILESNKNEICKSPEFKLTNEIDGTWMMQYKPFGPNFASEYASSRTKAIIENSPLGGLFKGRMTNTQFPNAALTLYIKGNKTVNAKWQWILKTHNPTPSTPRTAEKIQTFEACNSSYGLGGSMSLTTFFDNGKVVIQIKGILTWASELSKNPNYRLPPQPHHHHQPLHHPGNHHQNTVKSGNKSIPPKATVPPAAACSNNDSQMFQKVLEMERRNTMLQRESDQSNDENSILKNKINFLEKELGRANPNSNSYNESIIANLRSQNFELQQKNDALEKEIKRLKVNQRTGYGNNTVDAEEMITLIAEGREFKLPKSVIQNYSEMLENEDTDILELNCSASTLETFVNYCKTGILNFDNLINSDGILEMLNFVVEYKVNGLKAVIEENLISNLNYSNLHQYTNFAETYDLEELFQACLVMAKESLKSSTPISKEGLSKEFKTRLMEIMF